MTVLRRVGHARRGKASAVALALVFDLLAALRVRKGFVEGLIESVLGVLFGLGSRSPVDLRGDPLLRAISRSLQCDGARNRE